MAILEDLTDEECALYAILNDPSGLDQAEFLWVDEENDDGLFRCWSFQWPWWRDTTMRQIDQCSRSVGKSKSIQARAFAFPFVHPGAEMVVTAPESNHLVAVTDNIETSLLRSRLGREMLVRGRGGIKHKPFHINFSNGSRIMGRIPQRDGKGVKGIHPLWLELDEGQDFPDKGWIEIIETLKAGSVGAMWRAHGVTRGIRDYFFKLTQPDSGWKVHNYTAMHRPNWSDAERQAKIKEYGSRDHPDYRRNVLGAHGDATSSLFVLHRLMACVDKDETSDYNENLYFRNKIGPEMIEDYGGEILNIMDAPASHRKYKRTWIGMDVGYTNDPSEILVFAEESGKKASDTSKLRLISRYQLSRVSNPHQVDAIEWLINFYRPVAFALDKTGVGLPLYQEIQNRIKNNTMLRSRLDTIKGYNFSEKILIDFDEAKDYDIDRHESIADAGIKRNVLEYSSDKLRELVDDNRLVLPYDMEIISEFQGETYTITKSTTDLYGRKRFSASSLHALDAARMAGLAWAQHAIEELTNKEYKYPDIMVVDF